MDAGSRAAQILQHSFGVSQVAAPKGGGRIETTLNTELGRPPLLGLVRLLLQGITAQPEGSFASWVSPERTKAAVFDAVIADVDVAVDHVGHRVAHQLGPQTICPLAQQLARVIGT